MSWDADLICTACGHEIGSWNYTHNCNGMIEEALDPAGMDVTPTGEPLVLAQMRDAIPESPCRWRVSG